MCVIFNNECKVDFELTGELGVSTGGDQNQEWKQKLCDYKFWKKRNKGNKTWDTGTWKKKLQTIANGK